MIKCYKVVSDGFEGINLQNKRKLVRDKNEVSSRELETIANWKPL